MQRIHTQGTAAVHNSLSQAESHIQDTVSGFLSPNGIGVQRTSDTGHHRVEIVTVNRSADCLDNHGHLLLTKQVPAGLDVIPAALEECRGIDTLDGLAKLTQHPVLVLDRRTHISRVHTGERLIVAVLQLGT